MKRRVVFVIALLVISTMVMSVIPVLAARTPKQGQIFVKLLDSSGKPVAKTDVYLVQPDSGATTFAKATKGNGFVVFDLGRGDGNLPGWSSVYPVTVLVYHNGVGYVAFGPYPLNPGPSASLTIEITW